MSNAALPLKHKYSAEALTSLHVKIVLCHLQQRRTHTMRQQHKKCYASQQPDPSQLVRQ
jgi:hypothetical protein